MHTEFDQTEKCTPEVCVEKYKVDSLIMLYLTTQLMSVFALSYPWLPYHPQTYLTPSQNIK